MALKIRSCNLHSLEWSRSEGQGFLPLWKWCCSKGIMLIFSSKLLSWPTATSIFNLLLSSTKWILPTSLCWIPLCSSFLVVFLCFYTSYFFFYTVVSFSEELLLLCKERFRVHNYFCLSCKLRNTARKIYKHCTRPWSSSWKRTVKTVTFGTTKILSINLPLPDESLYACSFFFLPSRETGWLFYQWYHIQIHLLWYHKIEKMLPISPLFTEPLLRHHEELSTHSKQKPLNVTQRVQEKQRYFTWSFMVFPKSLTSFMLIAFFPPFSFPFFLFFFLNKHFLQRQKQQVRINRTATMAMAIKAQGGTRRERETHTKRR